MREIKFRAYHKKNKKMMPVIAIEAHMEVRVRDKEWWYPNFTVLMQYTGLKDKNGKEIYEGDVVEGRKETSESCYNVKSRVFYQDGCPAVEVDKDYHPCLYECCGLEIIGNIYENPEMSSAVDK